VSILTRAANLVVLALCVGNGAFAHPISIAAHPVDRPAERFAAESPWRLALSATDREQDHPSQSSHSFGALVVAAQLTDVSAKWAELQSRILADEATLAACRSGNGLCPAAAQRLLAVIELGRHRQGRARLGEINRAVNLSIRPVSDWAQYGVEDFWAAPLATMSSGAGDCEDYAIVKYVALREAGIPVEDLRLVIVRDVKHQANHAVVVVRADDDWLILDNRTFIMLNAHDARHYWPLFVLDSQGVRAPATAALLR
jgi:predicted transglutaminase-like cysteine proteinase